VADESPRTGGEVLEERKTETRKLPLYRVVLHNDDYTTMEFVVEILETVFHRSPAEALRIMMHVHTRGRGTCGAYSFEVAETKVALVHERAKENGFPLRASLEEEGC
jgi:ATP-dependent Clp protease adaptor protein ClpS